MDVGFFAEMAWKSALISAAALLLTFVLRSRSAADRALVLRIGVAMLLLLPLIAIALPSLEIVAFAAPEAPAPITLTAAELQLLALSASLAPAPEPTLWDDPAPLILLAYLGGLALVGSRLLAGLWTLRRWTASAREVTCPEWLAAFDRVRWAAPDPDGLRLMVSDGVKSPLSWGWRRPVILIDSDTLGEPEDADAILAHEVAHVARRDWPVLMLSRAAAALFWFNPLVWLLEREIVQQAEEAADCEAAQRVEPARYAETLLSWAHVNGAVPANSIAPSASALARRIRAILDRRRRERPSGSAWTALAMLLCLGIAAPVAAMKLVADAQEAPMPAAPGAPPPPAGVETPAAPAAAATGSEPAEHIVIDIPEIPDVGPIVNETLAAVLPQIPTIVASASSALHPEVAEEALRAAEEQMRRMRHLDEREIEAAMREARREMARARAEMRSVNRAEIEAAVRDAQRELARAQVRTRSVNRAELERAMREARSAASTVRLSMAHGADGMIRGAANMESSARRMEAEAERLRSDRAYRERAIERARERGETVTHEDLLEAAEGLREGAEGMREGAREMREAAERMRSGRS